MNSLLIKKAGSPPPYWPKAKSLLSSDRHLDSGVKSLLNIADSIVWDASPPSDKPNALAYVSSEDKNPQNGKVDKIHFVLSNWPTNATEEEIGQLARNIAGTLSHEYGHILSFDPNKGPLIDPSDEERGRVGEFVGDEAPADAKEQEYWNRVNSDPANSSDYNNSLSAAARLSIIRELVRVSDSLDNKGFFKEADMIDGIITKVHGKGPEEPVDLELGDFSNLGKTNITKDEAFIAGESKCEIEHEKHSESYMAKPQLSNIEERARSLNEMIQDGESIHDWMESYIAQADKMLTDVENRLHYDKK